MTVFFLNTSAQNYPPISNGGDLRTTVQLKATASDKWLEWSTDLYIYFSYFLTTHISEAVIGRGIWNLFRCISTSITYPWALVKKPLEIFICFGRLGLPGEDFLNVDNFAETEHFDADNGASYLDVDWSKRLRTYLSCLNIDIDIWKSRLPILFWIVSFHVNLGNSKHTRNCLNTF